MISQNLRLARRRTCLACDCPERRPTACSPWSAAACRCFSSILRFNHAPSSLLLFQDPKQLGHPRQKYESPKLPEAPSALAIAMFAGSDNSHERNVRVARGERVENIVAKI